MGFKIPAFGWSIGKTKKSAPSKKEVLNRAYKKVLTNPASGGSDKVKWPEMKEGPDAWYRPDADRLRKSTAAGLMRAAEKQFDAPPNYKLVFDHPDQDTFGPGGPRAFSSSAGLVNVPSAVEGYMSKPQYLASVLSHEVAHNVDWQRNEPWIREQRALGKNQGHSIEKFRPLEKEAYKSVLLEPRYDPGTDVGPGGRNEYPDEYVPLGEYENKFWRSANVQDPTRGLIPVDPKKLAVALALSRRNFPSASSKTFRRLDAGPSTAALS